MSSHSHSTTGQATAAFVSWLVTGAVGPALVALPVNLVADKLAGATVRWFRRLRQTDDLSRLVKAAAGTPFGLSHAEIKDLRELLEKEQTWRLLAAGQLNEKLQELTAQIAACLPAKGGRNAEDAREAASAIARGLLEFAVFDLEPEVFQKVVLARLTQMSDQASMLDEALFRLHKDLYALAEDAKDQYRQIMDNLPPGCADLGEVRIYLNTLISWLNTDPWPQDPRLGGPRLSPAAIERKLSVATIGSEREHAADADQLACRCTRLVILGGPGSGKTWLAMRTARICAEKALAALDEVSLDEVELPLYTTCAHLASAPGEIREAVASAALEWIGDLGGSRVVKALSLLFERRTPTLLVIDSLDEASDPAAASQRLRQVGELPWRVVLTSRQNSWNNQLNINVDSIDHCVGELQPLRYPEDVEPVVQRWFAGQPERAEALVGQIAQRRSLQRAATVPLILAFYCILGGQPLPEYKHDLYRKVINRMLRAPWRPGSGHPPKLERCWQALRAWAWEGATKNLRVSGVGPWDDDIRTQQAELSAAEQAAVDHVAAPRGRSDFDTDETLRRFVHRSLHEHAVAEYVVQLPADDAVEALLPHLWYDSEWEYAAPAAVVMHHAKDEILRALIRRACETEAGQPCLAAIDDCWEIRRFLARVAQQSSEGDWSPENAEMIGQARLEAATSLLGRDVPTSLLESLSEVVSGDWPTSNRLILEPLLDHLAAGNDSWPAWKLAEAIARLAVTAEERTRARAVLLGLLGSEMDHVETVTLLADTIARLDPTAEDRVQARQALLALLAREADPRLSPRLAKEIARMAITAQERAQVRHALLDQLLGRTGSRWSRWLVETLTGLDPTAEEQAQARHALLDLLPIETDPWAAVGLTQALATLGLTYQERARARQLLLDKLTDETESAVSSHMARTIARLEPTVQDRARARRTLLGQLKYDPNLWGEAGQLSEALVQVAVTAKERAQTRKALLSLFTDEADTSSPRERTWKMASAVTRLAVTAEERAQTRNALLGMLARQASSGMADVLVEAVARLEPTAQERAQVRQVLLGLLTDEADAWPAAELGESILRLGPTAQEQAQARQVLLGLLSQVGAGWMARWLANAVAQLGPTAQERVQARQVLLGLLSRESQCGVVQLLTDSLARLDPTPQDRAEACQALIRTLTNAAYLCRVESQTDAIVSLVPSTADRDQIRKAMLDLLASETWPRTAAELATAVVQLGPTAHEQAQARNALLSLLAVETVPSTATELADAAAGLCPTVADLGDCHRWPLAPNRVLLAAARQNSRLSAWIAALPLFSRLADTQESADDTEVAQ